MIATRYNFTEMFKMVSDTELDKIFTDYIANGMDVDDAGIETRRYEIENNFIIIHDVVYEKPTTIGDACDLIIQVMNNHRIDHDNRYHFILDNIGPTLDNYIDNTWNSCRNKIIDQYNNITQNSIDQSKISDIRNIDFNTAMSYSVEHLGSSDMVDKLVEVIVADTRHEIYKAIQKLVFDLRNDTTIILRGDKSYSEAIIISALMQYTIFHNKYIPCKIYIVSNNDGYYMAASNLFDIGYDVTIVFNIPSNSAIDLDGDDYYHINFLPIGENHQTYLIPTKFPVSIHNMIDNIKEELISKDESIGVMNIINTCDKFINDKRQADDSSDFILGDMFVSPTEEDLKMIIRIASKFNLHPIKIHCSSTDMIKNINIIRQTNAYAVTFSRLIEE